jgi:hypothetical protein
MHNFEKDFVDQFALKIKISIQIVFLIERQRRREENLLYRGKAKTAETRLRGVEDFARVALDHDKEFFILFEHKRLQLKRSDVVLTQEGIAQYGTGRLKNVIFY